MRPLGKVKELVESIGMGISYAYEDLVFLEHNAFLLQFGEANNTVTVHTNSEANEIEVNEGISRLKNGASSIDLEIIAGGSYTLSETEDDTISIAFHV